MKTPSTLFCAVVLIGALCAACDGNENDVILPVPANAEIAEFFKENKTYLIVRAFFDEGKIIAGKDGCIMINSLDELPEIDYLGDPIEYPAIDFDSHTLIIGHYFAASASYTLISQGVVVGSEKITMYISIDETMLGIAMPVMKPFYGLYPKLPNLPIEVVRK